MLPDAASLEDLSDADLARLRSRYQVMRAVESAYSEMAAADCDARLLRSTWSRRNRLSGLLASVMRIERERRAVFP